MIFCGANIQKIFDTTKYYVFFSKVIGRCAQNYKKIIIKIIKKDGRKLKRW